MSDSRERLTAALSDRYRIERELGAGGMATVYLAHDIKHDRDVAIKVLHPDLGAALGGERFLSEIRTTARLQHPHILPLLDSGEADGLLYYVMPLVTGETLRARLERERQLPIADAIRIAREVASALDYAHRQNVIHRDIKPENILLHDGSALVADFGIALAVQSAGGARMTQTGLSLGTPQYMSPEQAMGERTIDARSDIYALGAVTYEMLSGDAPFIGGSVQAIVAKVLSEKPTSLHTLRDTVPLHVEQTVFTALAKLPADRFENAKAFGDALATPAFAASGANTVRSTRAGRRSVSPALFIAISCVAIASLGAAAWAWRRPTSVSSTPRARFTLELPDSQAIVPTTSAQSLTVSPDGSEIVYTGVSSRLGRVLYRRRLDDLTVHEIPGTGAVIAHVFSPSGELAFQRADRVLTTVPRDGRPPAKIAEDVGRANWGDGDVIVFIRGGSLWRTNSSGNPVTRLTTVDSAAGEGHTWPFVLPGGEAVLFNHFREARPSNDMDVLAVRIADGKVTRLGIRGSSARYVSTGHILVAQSDGTILAAPFDLRTLEVQGPAVRVLEGVFVRQTGGALYDVSRNGVLAYVAGGEAQRPVMIDPNGREHDLGFTDGIYAHPRLSPNGERVVVERSEGSRSDIWILTRTTGQLLRMTRDGQSSTPEWSADGTRVGWLHTDTTGATIRWQRADGSATPETIPTPRRAPFRFIFTPDGKSIVVVVGGPFRHDIMLFPLVGSSAPRMLTNADADELQPSISPDGRWLAFTSNETLRSEVFVVSITDPSTRVQITTNGASEPVWRGDGRSLVARSGTAFVSLSLGFSSGVEVTRRDSIMADTYLRGNADRAVDVTRRTGELLTLARSGSKRDRIVIVTGWLDELKERMTQPAKR